MGVVLSLAAHASNIIAHATIAADQNTHGTNLVLCLHANQGINVWPAREHLDGGTWALYLPGITWTSDEEHDPEDLPAAFHAQDGRHPWPNPLEVFRGLDDPYERDSSGSDRAISVAINKMADERDMVCDTHTACKEDNSPIGVKGVDAPIGSLSKGLESNLPVRAAFSALVKLISESRSTTDKKGNCRLLKREYVLAGHDDAFFVSNNFLGLAPCDGERV